MWSDSDVKISAQRTLHSLYLHVCCDSRRRSKQLLGDLEKMREYWKLKEEALNRNRWRIGFGRGYGPVLRQIAD
jgi:hypothetical protein